MKLTKILYHSYSGTDIIVVIEGMPTSRSRDGETRGMLATIKF